MPLLQSPNTTQPVCIVLLLLVAKTDILFSLDQMPTLLRTSEAFHATRKLLYFTDISKLKDTTVGKILNIPIKDKGNVFTVYDEYLQSWRWWGLGTQ